MNLIVSAIKHVMRRNLLKWLFAFLALAAVTVLILFQRGETVSADVTAARFRVGLEKLGDIGFRTVEERSESLAIEELSLPKRFNLRFKRSFVAQTTRLVIGFPDRSECNQITDGSHRFECVLHFEKNVPIAVTVRYPSGSEKLSRQLQQILQREKLGVPINCRMVLEHSSSNAVGSAQSP